jgi:fructose-1,6-bisphosphatase/inositol monophosphatase family enzyme
MTPIDDEVRELLRDVADRELVPRFRGATRTEVLEKSRGEVVTEADLAVERALTAALEALLPGSVVVGEEGSHANPQLLARLPQLESAWVLDPLDGTRHFADGVEIFGIMVALVHGGRSEAAWIHLPMSGHDAHGRRGQGASLDGARVELGKGPPFEQMRGALMTRFLPDGLRAGVEAGRAELRTDQSHLCAAQRYVDILAGREHFALYHRTLPWDHAAGVLLIEEAGGVARRYDGTRYSPASGENGLLVAVDAPIWRKLHDLLLPSVPLQVEL